MLKQSETIGLISAALVKAQKKIGSAVKESDNAFTKKKYADLTSVMDACKQHLNDNGISIIQPIHFDENGYYLTTELRHESGEFFASTIKLILTKPDMQQLGAASTYARRYGLQSMVGIPAEDDDSGGKSKEDQAADMAKIQQREQWKASQQQQQAHGYQQQGQGTGGMYTQQPTRVQVTVPRP